MRITLRVSLLSLVVVLALSLLHPQNVRADEQLRVGVLLPLSGQLSFLGVPSKAGIELAKRKHPELFSSISFFYEDSRSDARAAVAGMRRLLDVERVEVLIGYAASMPNNVQRFVAERGVPVILIVNLLEFAQEGENVFNLGTPLDNVEKLISAWLSTRRCRQAKALLVSHPAVTRLGKELESRHKSLEIVASYRPTEFDFRSGLIKASHKKTDCVLAAIPSESVERFVSQLKNQSMGANVLLLQVGGDVLPAPPLAPVEKQEMVTITIQPKGEILDDYTKYSNSQKVALAQGYEVAKMLGSIEGKDSAAVLQGLSGKEVKKSSLGKVSYIDEDGTQFFEIKPQFRTIWNRQRRRYNR